MTNIFNRSKVRHNIFQVKVFTVLGTYFLDQMSTKYKKMCIGTFVVSIALGSESILCGFFLMCLCVIYFIYNFYARRQGGGGMVAQSVERATPCRDVPGSDPT